MTPLALFDGGWGSEREELTKKLAILDNDEDVPLSHRDDRTRALAIQDAIRRGWSAARIAAAFGICVKHAKGLIKEHADAASSGRDYNQNILGNLLQVLKKGDRVQAPGALALLFQKYQGHCPVRDCEVMRAVLEEGVAKGLFEIESTGSGRWKEPTYVFTDAVLKRDKPLTAQSRAQKGCRALRVVQKMNAADIVSLPVSLGLAGVNYVLENVVNNQGRFRPLYDYVVEHQISGREHNFATMLALSPVTSELEEDSSGLQPFFAAITNYIADVGEIWTLRAPLSPTHQKQFRREVPTLVEELRKELATAGEKDGAEDCRKPFLLSFGFAKI